MSAGPDRGYRRVQCFDILLCKSAIGCLVVPSYSIAVFCTLSHLFVRFVLYSGFCLLRVCLAVHVQSLSLLGGDAFLLSGSPKLWNPEPNETENQNSESTNQRKQVLQIYEKLLCRAFALKKFLVW